MAVITLARFLAITDALAAAVIDAKGTSTNGIGDNDTEEPSSDVGARDRLGTLNDTILAYAEDDYIGLMQGIRDAIDIAGWQSWAERVLEEPLDALDDLCAAAGLTGVTNMTSFATYYNYGTGGAWTGLVAPAFGRGVYRYVRGSNLEAKNVYAPAITTMASKTVGSSFVAGTAVDITKYAGAARLQCSIASRTGTGLVVVTGDGRSATGATVTGRSWTANMTGDGPTTMTPAITGDICTQVTGITIDAGITVGDVTISCAIPSGRTSYVI